jgi:hypothetical protein
MSPDIRQFKLQTAHLLAKKPSSPNLTLWFLHHQNRLLYFQNQQYFIGNCLSLSILASFASLLTAFLNANTWVWFLTFLTLAFTTFLASYFYSLTTQVQALARQQTILLEKVLQLKTKPWLTVTDQLVAVITTLLRKYFLTPKKTSHD